MMGRHGRASSSVRRGRSVPVAILSALVALALFCVHATALEKGGPAEGEDFIWIEAEDAKDGTFKDNGLEAGNAELFNSVLSGGGWLAHDGRQGEQTAQATWEFEVARAGTYRLYCRKYWYHGPFKWAIDRGPFHEADRIDFLDEVKAGQFACMNWVDLGTVGTTRGDSVLTVQLLGRAPEGVGTATWESRGEPYVAAFDCFCLVRQGVDFVPAGKLKPTDPIPTEGASPGWWAFRPRADDKLHATAADRSPIDMRNVLGGGPITKRIKADGERFVAIDPDTEAKEEVRFWGVCVEAEAVRLVPDASGLPMTDPAWDRVKDLAAMLAKRGVNLVRINAPVTANLTEGDPRIADATYLAELYNFVQAMKAEGIYTALSIYSPLWFTIGPDWGMDAGLAGEHPWCLLFFDDAMKGIYARWEQAVLQYDGGNGKLGADPALAIWQVCNEDSLFSWHFTPRDGIPEAVIAPVEQRFVTWVKGKYGVDMKTIYEREWGNPPLFGGDSIEGLPDDKVVLISSYFMSDQYLGADPPPPYTARAMDQAEFLASVMADVYAEHDREVTRLSGGSPDETGGTGYWNPFGNPWAPHDRRGDWALPIMARHSYFAGSRRREAAGGGFVSVDPLNIAPDEDDGEVRPLVAAGDLYRDLLAPENADLLRIRENEYLGKAHLVAEYCFPMANAYRTCSALLASVYGALQGTDGFCFFRVDSERWARTLGAFPVMTPAVLGQFPAAALAFRRGDVQEGIRVHDRQVSWQDVPGTQAERSRRPAPRSFYAGRAVHSYVDGAPSALQTSEPYDFPDDSVVPPGLGTQRVELKHHGPPAAPDAYVSCSTPRFQAATGMLGRMPAGKFDDCRLLHVPDGFYGCVMVISLTDKPIRESDRILIQVMTEERTYGFSSVHDPSGMEGVVSAGTGPVNVRALPDPSQVANPITIKLFTDNANNLKIEALDANGNVRTDVTPTFSPAGIRLDLELEPDVLYYYVSPA